MKVNLYVDVRSYNETNEFFAGRVCVTHARYLGERNGRAVYRVLGTRVRSSRCSSSGFDHQIGWGNVIREFGKTLDGRTYLFLPVDSPWFTEEPGPYERFDWWTEPFGRLKKPD